MKGWRAASSTNSAPACEWVRRRDGETDVLPAQLKETKAAERAGFWRYEDEGEFQFTREQRIHIVLNATIVQTHVDVRHRAAIGI